MREKVELKITLAVAAMLFIGIVLIGVMVALKERASLYHFVESNSSNVAMILTKEIERTMIENRQDITKALLDDIRKTKIVEDVLVINSQGREAFKKDAPASEAEAMRKLIGADKPITAMDSRKYILYQPLRNTSLCRGCHMEEEGAIRGAVKVTMSIEKEYRDAARTVITVIAGAVTGALALNFILWFMLRRIIIRPLKLIEAAAAKFAEGDMSFDVPVKTKDEIARLSQSIRESSSSLGLVLRRIKDVSVKISHVAGNVERDSKKVMDGTQIEAEAIADISSSIEEMNAAISEITEGTDSLAASAEQTAASMDEMAASIGQIKHSSHDLSGAIEATSSSIEELSATIKEVAKNTDNLSLAVDETFSSIGEITYSVKEIELNAKESAKLSEKAMNDASTFGMTSIEKTIGGMKNIKLSVEKTNDFIKRLGKRSEEIGKILNVIDDITDQTALLALNAAILAAQAGEHGKGFSVVADEIKDLAERTAFSTQEISTLILSVQQEVKGTIYAMGEGLRFVEEGFNLSKDASGALKKILESSKMSSEMAFSIERSTGEQARAVRSVSEAMERIKNMSGMIARTTSEQSRGVTLIMTASEKMRDAAQYVMRATEEQSINSRQISQAIEVVSDKSQQISRAIHEQKTGSNQIWNSIEKIKDIPKTNRDLAFNVNNALKVLLRDAELLDAESKKFKFSDGKSHSVIRFGIVPLGSPAEMFKTFGPLADYLSRKVGKKIELKVAVDFEEAVSDIGKNITQLCSMGPSSYIAARKMYDLDAIVKALRDGKPYQHAVIITRENSGIDSLKQIKGKTFAFVDSHSTTGYIVPRAMLLESGFDIKDLHYYNYLGSHDDVAKAVLRGDFDAGGVMEGTAYKFKEQGLKSLKVSENIPEFNVCVNKSLNKETRSILKSALASLDGSTPEGSLILGAIGKSYTGFTEAKDEDYDNIKFMMAKLGMV